MIPPSTRRRLGTILQRRLARWFGRRPMMLAPGPAIISFSFDDFPQSALRNAGPILERYGIRATYYTALGLAGQTGPTGRIFDLVELPDLVDRGHELGCHTFGHQPAWETRPAEFEAAVCRNAEALAERLPGAIFRTLSYPISYPRPTTKRLLAGRFAACRGGGQRFNHDEVDLNYLDAFFLEQSRDHPSAIQRTIDAAVAQGGWLIFATHDVSNEPTRYGCTTALFEQVVRWASMSGAVLLPVAAALERLEARRAPLAPAQAGLNRRVSGRAVTS